MPDSTLAGRPKANVDTPALLLDIEAVEENVARMAALFKGRPCALRPHVKTHKLPLIAHKQIAAGGNGITCAKISEAQIFLEHGIGDILIANQIVGPVKISRLANLARHGRLTVAVDNEQNAKDLSAGAVTAGSRINVLVEINVGLGRCGVAPGEPALTLAQAIRGLDGIEFKGVMGYEGGMFIKDRQEKEERCREANRALVDTRDLLVANGIPVEVVSAGGSNTYGLTGFYPGITEIQVGSYVTMDLHNAEYGLDFRQTLSVLATVISRPELGRAVIDAGLKALSADAGLPRCLTPGVHLTKLNEEHGHLIMEDRGISLKVGDKIELVPSHGCTTIPLHDRYVLVRNGVVESVAPIAARGAMV